jgi:DNA primase
MEPVSKEIIQILETELNLRHTHVKGNELWALCINPHHKDLHATNFSINLETGKAHCFSCGFSGNIVTILSDNGISYEKAIKLWQLVRENADNEIEIPDYRLDKYLVDTYKSLGKSKYALDRLKSEELLDIYGIYADKNNNPIFLPRDIHGNYKSVWVRENNRYFLIEPLQAKQWGDLLGAHLPATEYTILVEGHFDAPSVYGKTSLKTISGFGTNLTSGQLAILRKMAPLIILFDGDKAGKMSRDILHARLIDTECYFCGGYTGDPDELSKEQLEQIISKKKSWTEYLEWKIKYAKH